MRKKPPYNFGISQEDALTEKKALELKKGDALLCIASGGEIPLNLLALCDISIVACDISMAQIYLSKIKLAAILCLERDEAAKFIGFYPAKPEERIQFYKKLKKHLSGEEIGFWTENISAIESGVVNVARYEKYILKFSWVLRLLLGKGKIKKLMGLRSTDEQRRFFDRKISNWWIKLLFKIAFHPKVYKNRGVLDHGLQHQKDASIATFFFNRFRDFCTSTPASENYYLQYTLFGYVQFPNALPEYLSEKGINNIRKNHMNLSFDHTDFTSALTSKRTKPFNKFHLSNIGDWLNQAEMNLVFETIHTHGSELSSIALRFIHQNHPIPKHIKMFFDLNVELGNELVKTDRYPFYNVIPINYNRM